MTTIDTNKAMITWSPTDHGHQATVRRLATDRRPCSATSSGCCACSPSTRRLCVCPHCVSARRRRELVIEAIDGEPLDPKFPLEIADGDVDDVLATVDRLGVYRPRRRWFRRFDVAERLRARRSPTSIARSCGARPSPPADDALRPRRRHRPQRAAGIAPASSCSSTGSGRAATRPSYDRAFFWFSLVDVPAARQRVARFDQPWFVLSALLIQLFHLWMWAGRARPAHLATLDELLERVRELAHVTRLKPSSSTAPIRSPGSAIVRPRRSRPRLSRRQQPRPAAARGR